MRNLCVLFCILCTLCEGQQGLTITVLQGEAGRNVIKTRTGIPIELEVRDPAGKPVPGAQIIVQLPTAGPSGSFPGGQLTKRTTTGPNGQAVITGFVPNDIEGRFNVKITADSGTLSAAAVVSQTNIAALAQDKKSHKGLWILVAIAGGGAAAGIAAASGGKSSSSSSGPAAVPTVTVSAGTVTVGGPR